MTIEQIQKEAYEKGKEEAAKPTVLSIIGEVVKEMCDNYCKWPLELTDEDELNKRCDICPLNRLW